MNFEVYHPKGILKDFVESILFMSGNGTGVALQRLYQTIIINMGAPFGVSDLYTSTSKEKVLNATIWINGKQEIPFMLGNSGGMEMYVIGLLPGRLPYLADLPAIETNEQAVDASHWTSAEIFNLREELLASPTIHSGFLLIEKYLTTLLLKKDFSNLDKIKWLDKAIHTCTVEEICRSLGVTRKKLRSETQHYFGGSAKNIQGILRFNNTLAVIANNAGQSLSSLHQYYDQSHFINDFKARAGITPLQYRRLCRQYPEIKYTPNFIPIQKETFIQSISGLEA